MNWSSIKLLAMLSLASTNVNANKSGCLILSPPVFDLATINRSSFDVERERVFDFSQRQRVLFLNFGKGPGAIFSDTNATLISGDRYLETKALNDFSYYQVINGKYTATRHVQHDNNFLPFAPKTFDLIISTNGICACSTRSDPSVTCGNIKIDPEYVNHFFTQIIDRLSPDNPISLALITGRSFRDWAEYDTPGTIVAATMNLATRFPLLNFHILRDGYMRGKFVGIAVTVKGGISIESNLRMLIPPDPWSPFKNTVAE